MVFRSQVAGLTPKWPLSQTLVILAHGLLSVLDCPRRTDGDDLKSNIEGYLPIPKHCI